MFRRRLVAPGGVLGGGHANRHCPPLRPCQERRCIRRRHDRTYGGDHLAGRACFDVRERKRGTRVRGMPWIEALTPVLARMGVEPAAARAATPPGTASVRRPRTRIA